MDLVPTLHLLVYRLQMADWLGKQEELDAQNEGELTPHCDPVVYLMAGLSPIVRKSRGEIARMFPAVVP